MIWTRAWALALLLIPLALWAVGVGRARQRRKLMRTLADESTLKKLLDPLTPRYQALKGLARVLAGVFFVAALAGPRWGQQFQEVRRRGVDVVVAVDLSQSMLAEDIRPNRLTQAKRELSLLINKLEGDRVGVVAFAGTAFLQCPLTLDYNAARQLLDILDTDLVPVPGTSLARALEVACDAFVRTERKHKALVLLTDGEDHSPHLRDAQKRAVEEGVRVFAIGFGSPEGEVIPLKNDSGQVVDYVKDKDGKTVVTKLGEATLTQLAQATGGRYYPASEGEVEVDRLAADIHRLEDKALESRVYENKIDRTAWPLTVAMLLLVLELLLPEVSGHFARLGRELRSISLLLMLLLGAAPASAEGRYQGTVDHLRRQAEKNPQSPQIQYNLGNALYKNGDFKMAQDVYDRALALEPPEVQKGELLYNAGNAMYRQNKPSEAVEKYKSMLRLNPGDRDAKHNLELAKKLMAEQKKSKASPDKQEGQPPPPDEYKKESASPQPGDMTKEDAERLLQAMEEQEKEARKKRKMEKPKQAPSGNPW